MTKINDLKEIDILIMEDNNFEIVGGAQESTKIIIKGIKDLFSVGVIQPGKINKKLKNVEYYDLTDYTRLKFLFKNPIKFLKYIIKVKNVINKINPKIIHTQSQASFFIVSFLKKLKWISTNIKLIHTERGLYTKYSKFFKYLFRIFISDAHVWITTTEYNMCLWKKAINDWGKSINIKVIENTAGYIFENYNEKLEKSDSTKFTVGFAGRYTEWKNWPLAVEICKKLDKHIGDNLLVKMAVGCDNSKSKEQTLEMFSELNRILGKRFEGLTNITLEEMDKFYYDIDVFVLTSKRDSESFGRTLVEAMSRKTAVLTTNSGGSVEVVGDKNNVFNTAEEFVDRILEFYNNRDLLNFEKEKNYLRVKEKYSTQNNIEKHISLYTDLLNDS